VIKGKQDIHLLLFHVPAPMPPELLEFGGRERPDEERQTQVNLEQAQAAWREQVVRDAQPVFAATTAVLREAQVPEQAIETHICTPPAEQELDTSILEAAREHACQTIVVGRESYSWLQELFQTHIADKLLQKSQGLTVWVVT
jgi:K+-sensing histidine kinase KdpD